MSKEVANKIKMAREAAEAYNDYQLEPVPCLSTKTQTVGAKP